MDGSLFNKALLPMAPSNSADSPRFHFRLWHIFYGMAVLACSLTLFGLAGVLVAIVLLAGIVVSIYGIPIYLRNRHAIHLILITIGALVVFGKLISPIRLERSSPSSPRRVNCLSNLRQIQMAIMNYHGHKERFPPPFFVDKAGKRTHSWRVMLLPYIDEYRLYDRYRFDEPWDGPNNRKLIPEMPQIYRCPSQKVDERCPQGYTTYMAISGENTSWSGKRLTSATENDAEISLFEVPGKAIPWTCPDDPTLDEFLELSQQPAFPWQGIHGRVGLFTEQTGVCCIALTDGSVRCVSALATTDEWRELLEHPQSKWSERRFARTASRIRWNVVIPFGILVLLVLLPYFVYVPIWIKLAIPNSES